MLVVAAVPQPRQGVVEVRDDGSVVRFLPAGPSTGSSRHVNAGVYLLERSLVAALEPGRCSSLERDVLPGLAGRGLHALEAAGPLLDIGTPEGYEIAVRQLGSAATALSSPHGA
jgi:NDP-sugar pyrophosphorylase family protein